MQAPWFSGDEDALSSIMAAGQRVPLSVAVTAALRVPLSVAVAAALRVPLSGDCPPYSGKNRVLSSTSLYVPSSFPWHATTVASKVVG